MSTCSGVNRGRACFKADEMVSNDHQVVHPFTDVESSSAYHALRSTGVLKLPSERTLRDYTNIIEARLGFQSEVDEQLGKEANVLESADHEKYIALIFDEVKILYTISILENWLVLSMSLTSTSILLLSRRFARKKCLVPALHLIC